MRRFRFERFGRAGEAPTGLTGFAGTELLIGTGVLKREGLVIRCAHLAFVDHKKGAATDRRIVTVQVARFVISG
jgi:hypothetical protein